MFSLTPDMLSEDILGSYTWGWMKVINNPSSYDYLEYARQDLREGHAPRNLINSVSNAKRALHSRLEDVCLGFGAKNNRYSKKFPCMIKYTRACGVVAPEVLHLLNSLRNDVEHEYAIPSLENATIFIGVVELFLSATDRWKDRQPCEADIFKELETDAGVVQLVKLKFDWERGVASIFYRTKQGDGHAIGTVSYQSPSEEFFSCAKFILTNDY